MNTILVDTVKKRLPGVYLITDEQADKYFTENDLWDDYFSYVSLHAARGLVGIDELTRLYSQLRVDTVFSVTSDFRFSGAEGMYPRNFNTFVSLQVLDLPNGTIVWDGLVECQEVIEFEEEREEMVIKTFRRVSEKLLAEMTGN